MPLSKVLKKPLAGNETSRPSSHLVPPPMSPFLASNGTTSAPNSRPGTPVPCPSPEPVLPYQNGGVHPESPPSIEGPETRSQKSRDSHGTSPEVDASTKSERQTLGQGAPETGHGGVPVFVMMPLDTVSTQSYLLIRVLTCFWRGFEYGVSYNTLQWSK